MKVIIPCAGFGTRVGSPLVKELIPSKISGKPLIDFILEEAIIRKWEIHIITRAEKTPLIDHVKNLPNTTVQIVEPTKEWPHSIIESKIFWEEKNLLVLPDTYFSPKNILDDIESYLCCFEAVYAVIEKETYETWGAVNISAKNIRLIEKPHSNVNRNHYRAWGLIGFQKDVGETIFRAHLESTFDHQEKNLRIKGKFVSLDIFDDLTRSGHTSS